MEKKIVSMFNKKNLIAYIKKCNALDREVDDCRVSNET